VHERQLLEVGNVVDDVLQQLDAGQLGVERINGRHEVSELDVARLHRLRRRTLTTANLHRTCHTYNITRNRQHRPAKPAACAKLTQQTTVAIQQRTGKWETFI